MRRLELKILNHQIKLPDDVKVSDGDKVIVFLAEPDDDFLNELESWEMVGIDDLSKTFSRIENETR